MKACPSGLGSCRPSPNTGAAASSPAATRRHRQELVIAQPAHRWRWMLGYPPGSGCSLVGLQLAVVSGVLPLGSASPSTSVTRTPAGREPGTQPPQPAPPPHARSRSLIGVAPSSFSPVAEQGTNTGLIQHHPDAPRPLLIRASHQQHCFGAAPVSRDDPESSDPGGAAIPPSAQPVTANPTQPGLAVLNAGGSAVDALVTAQLFWRWWNPRVRPAGGGFLL